MTITIIWGNAAHTVLLCELPEQWAWDDFYEMHSRYWSMVETVPHRVHVIYHFLSGKINVPPLVLLHMPELMRMSHPREDRTVLVGTSIFAKRFLNVLASMGLREFTERFSFVETLPEAYQQLEVYEATLQQQQQLPT
jgi:hypothetical protein